MQDPRGGCLGGLWFVLLVSALNQDYFFFVFTRDCGKNKTMRSCLMIMHVVRLNREWKPPPVNAMFFMLPYIFGKGFLPYFNNFNKAGIITSPIFYWLRCLLKNHFLNFCHFIESWCGHPVKQNNIPFFHVLLLVCHLAPGLGLAYDGLAL